MNIEIIGAESLGVRGLCCFVRTKDRNILIDPGIALGYMRYRLLPHPAQIAVGERVQKKIINRWREATDIVISHFHGDHVPLADANPYQLHIKRLIGLNPHVRVWTKDPSHFSPTEKGRATSLSSILPAFLIEAEGKKEGPMAFSGPVPHGEANDNLETVMMTRIEENKIFIHAPDIQLLDDKTVSEILYWRPDILLAGGPPLYLHRLSEDQINRAWNNALRLSQAIDHLILDHHLMRSHEGLQWLKRLSSKTGKTISCAADFMHRPRLLLEAERRDLYRKMPVPDEWHEDYARGKVAADNYTAQKFYNLLNV